MFPSYGYNPQTNPLPQQQNPVGSGDSGIKNIAPPPAADQATRDAFLAPNLTSPFTNASDVYGNLGSYSGAMVPQAAGFMNQLWDPNLNNFESSFLNAGVNNASKLMEQGLGRVEGQFEGNPSHSALPRAQGEVINQFANDAMSTAGQMGMQRQQLGAQMAQFPFQNTAQMAQNNVNNTQQLWNMGNQQFNAPIAAAMSYYTQAPFTAPTLVPQSSGGGKV